MKVKYRKQLRKSTLFKKANELANLGDMQVAVVIREAGRYEVYRSVDDKKWPPSMKRMRKAVPAPIMILPDDLDLGRHLITEMSGTKIEKGSVKLLPKDSDAPHRAESHPTELGEASGTQFVNDAIEEIMESRRRESDETDMEDKPYIGAHYVDDEIEKIIDSRWDGGELEYLVEWRDSELRGESWEPIWLLEAARASTTRFHEQNPSKPKLDQGSRTWV
ncbi:MAG: hypothetical protein M1823_004245 [Watsoniomyces obsoletus]|nr:MAG: hypothetical protein M1823_004245 [Watsoniomyces obsoletus]